MPAPPRPTPPAHARSPRRPAATALAVGLVALVLAFNPAATRPARAYPGSAVTLVGHGWGHGRGMGQYGALGYALGGWGYGAILDHFYGGTTTSTVSNVTMTVRLTRLDNLDTIAAQERGLGTVNGSGNFTGLRAQLVGPNSFQVFTGPGCAGPWTALGGPMAGPVSFSSPNSGDDHTTMLQTCEAGGNRWYRGDLLAVDSGSGPRTVGRLDLDSYVRGVVPRESPASWGDLGSGAGMNALRAQAVAARSYGDAQNSSPPFAKTCDTDACQVYGGVAMQQGGTFIQLEQPQSNQATTDTAGQVRVFGNGQVASTEFSSSTGGYTAGGVFPAVVDDGDATPSNPNHTWSASIPVGDIQNAYPSIGTLLAVNVTRRNGLGDLGGRVVQLVVEGTSGSVTVSGADFRSRFGLKSDWFAVTNGPNGGIDGYWVVAPDGGIFAFGAAGFFGSMGGKRLNQPVVGMAAAPAANGYWQVASDGGIFAFGGAGFFGSMGGRPLNKPMVGMAPTATGNGYWTVASDGGIFAFGGARFFGSMGGRPLNKPVVGMARTPSGKGYWLVASDGGIFSFGDAQFHGSTGAIRLNQPVVGMASAPSGAGYWLIAADGGLFAFNVPFFGSLPGIRANDGAGGMGATATGGGYEIVGQSGRVYPFGDAPYFGDVAHAVPGYRGGVRGIDLKHQ